jgi:hypothetical protein
MKAQTYKLPESARQAIFAESDSGREKARIENARTQFKRLNPDLDFFGKELAKKSESSKIQLAAHNRSQSTQMKD